MRRLPGELGLAAQIAFASRTTRLRTLLTALGVALGVVVLLIAASVPHAYAARQTRERAAAPVNGVHGHLRMLSQSTIFRGVTITEDAVQISRGAHGVPVPPGVTRLPGPGEMVVSPEVARLLRGPGGSELRRRLRARVVGTIAPAGVIEPGAALVYRGSDELNAQGIPPTTTGFGVTSSPSVQRPLITLLVVVIVVALLLPVSMFVASAARFGAEERDRRLSAMRLLGADRAMTARIAAGESLVGVLIGVALGAAAFLVAAPTIARVGIASLSAYPSDLRPSPTLAALVAVLVTASAVAATLISIRRVAVEPLGVSRRGASRARRLGWRILVPALGFLSLVPLLLSSGTLSSASGQVEATAGVILVLVGVTALLPWLVESVVRHAPDGPLSWLLAVRRLRLEEATTGRVIGGIGLAVAGAVALSIVFSAAQADVRGRPTAAQARTLNVAIFSPNRARARRDLAALRAVAQVAVDQVQVVRQGRGLDVSATVVPRDNRPAIAARVADTAAALDPLAQVYPSSGDGNGVRILGELRQALVAGALLVMAMIGASLLVAAGEGLRERRSALAMLGAVGARRSTVVSSMLWQTMIPVTGGLALAVMIGMALGAVLSAIAHVHAVFDWSGIGLMLGAGAAVIAAVTLLTLPTVGRAMRPQALRVE